MIGRNKDTSMSFDYAPARPQNPRVGIFRASAPLKVATKNGLVVCRILASLPSFVSHLFRRSRAVLNSKDGLAPLDTEASPMPEELHSQSIANSYEHDRARCEHETQVTERTTEEVKKRMTIFPECPDCFSAVYPTMKKGKS
jgi:hypothetical protein